MSHSEILSLTASGNRKLVLHALNRWSQECSQDPEPLFNALKSDDPEILKPALSLAVKHHPRTCSTVILSFLDRSDPLFRRLAVEHLAPVMGEEISDKLKNFLREEKNPFVLASAVQAVPRLSLPLEVLEPFLTHEDSRVRANTVKAISGCTGEKRRLIEPLLKDPVLRVQNEALKALSGLVPEAKLEELVQKRLSAPEEKIRSGMAFFVADLPLSRKISILAKLLKDPETSVVACAARGLAKTRDPMAWRALVELFLGGVSPELNALLRGLLKEASPAAVMAQAEKIGQPSGVSTEVINGILEIAGSNERWEAFVPWILGGLERPELPTRLLALDVVRRHVLFFKVDLDSILRKFEVSLEPAEKSTAAQIRLRANQLQGLEVLKTMIRDPRTPWRREAARALREEPGLLVRKILQDAAKEGIPEARDPSSGSFDPVSLDLPEA